MVFKTLQTYEHNGQRVPTAKTGVGWTWRVFIWPGSRLKGWLPGLSSVYFMPSLVMHSCQDSTQMMCTWIQVLLQPSKYTHHQANSRQARRQPWLTEPGTNYTKDFLSCLGDQPYSRGNYPIGPGDPAFERDSRFQTSQKKTHALGVKRQRKCRLSSLKKIWNVPCRVVVNDIVVVFPSPSSTSANPPHQPPPFF